MGGFTGGSQQALWLTYGANFLWLSQTTPNDDGAIAKVSPTSGLVAGATNKGLDIGLTCAAAGAGAVWTTERPDSVGPEPAPAVPPQPDEPGDRGLRDAARRRQSRRGAVRDRRRGLVYVTDGVGSLYTIQP